jgi:hypothetical protein
LTGIILNIYIFPQTYKTGTIKTLILQIWKLSSSDLHQIIQEIRGIAGSITHKRRLSVPGLLLSSLLELVTLSSNISKHWPLWSTVGLCSAAAKFMTFKLIGWNASESCTTKPPHTRRTKPNVVSRSNK